MKIFIILLIFKIQVAKLFHFRLTCIYASCKVEENHVSAEELGKGIQQDHQVILNNEMLVLQVCICNYVYPNLFMFLFTSIIHNTIFSILYI